MFDLIVIGAGSGGVRAARTAAALGARVAIIESRFFGGTCVNVGCVPKKLFSYGASFPDLFRLSQDYGYAPVQPVLDWARLRDNKSREILRLNGIYRRLLEQAGVTIIEGHGVVTGEGQVRVGDTQLTGKHILLATGGKPFLPDVPGRELVRLSDDLFSLPSLPARVAVVGGGYIACEFASILQGLGCEVHQLYRGELFLRGFDHEVRQFVAGQMALHGVQLHFNTDVSAVVAEADGRRRLQLSGGDTLLVDEVFYATGRVPNIDGLFDGVMPELAVNGAVRVDECFRTSVAGVYAVGDLIDRLQLTPVALAEGMWLARYLFAPDQAGPAPEYDFVPTAMFCHPNIGTVGLGEEQALERHGHIRVYRSEFRSMKYTLGDSPYRTLMKLIVDDASDQVIGLHMVGDDAGEIVQGFAVAIRQGATKADFDRTIGIHPTAAEEFVTLRTGQRVSAGGDV